MYVAITIAIFLTGIVMCIHYVDKGENKKGEFCAVVGFILAAFVSLINMGVME